MASLNSSETCDDDTTCNHPNEVSNECITGVSENCNNKNKGKGVATVAECPTIDNTGSKRL